MTKIVLFGAGASHGSGSAIPQPPPLGKDLFAALRRLYASWRSIPEAETSLFEANFETGMGSVIERYGMAVAPLMQDMAIFFSIFTLRSDTQSLYSTLFRELKDPEKIIWSSLNYECLLELGVAASGRKVNYFGEPSDPELGVPVWKLHGSCNFKVSGLEAGRGVSFGTGVVFNGGIEILEPAQVQRHYKGNTALYPAMALFAKNKPITMAPSPIQDAQTRWQKHVSASEKVVVIGVRPNPEDKHLWDCLSSCAGEIALVCSENEYLTWTKAHRPTLPTKWLGTKWSAAHSSVMKFLA